MNTIATQKGPESENAQSEISFVTPVVNIHQDGEGYMLEVEMPGVGKGGVEVTYEDGKLILTGHRNRPAVAGKELYRESGDFAYRRIFDLDPSIDGSRISASIDQGLLKVSLPRAEAAKPRKITIS